MYISSAQPVNHLDALPILLDHVLGGDDVTLTDEGDSGRLLLDLAAGCLGGLRSRVLWAAQVLPGASGVPGGALGGVAGPPPHPAGPSKASVADDAVLSQGFHTLTALDPTCDRIVLLVGDAHALQPSTLRYIQFVSRCGGHLQLVFCGTGSFLELLNPEEFAWLRARLLAGLVMTLAPTAKAPSPPPGLRSVPDRPAAWVGETAAPSPGARRPAVSAGMPPRMLRLGALALLGLGGVAWLAFGTRNGEADRPAASRQAAAVPQPPTTAQPPAVSAPATQALDGSRPHAGSRTSAAAPGAAPGSPSGLPVAPSAASGAPVAAWPQAKAGVPGPGPASASGPNQLRPPEPLPSPPPGFAQQAVPAAPSRTTAVTQPPTTAQPPAVSAPGMQAPGMQAIDGPASHAGSEMSPAAPDAPAAQPPVTAGDVPGAAPGSPSGMPVTPPPAASGALVAVLPQTKTAVSGSESNRQPQPGMAPSPGRQDAATAASRTAAAAPGSRARRPREAADKPALPAADHRPVPGPASRPATGFPEPQGGGSPQYIGSYATDASGVRVFHLEP